jgi:hypothetical protein
LCSSRIPADNIPKHVISFPQSAIWLQQQQTNTPGWLHFYVSSLSKKCHGSRNCWLHRLGRPLNLHLHPGALPFDQLWKGHWCNRIAFTGHKTCRSNKNTAESCIIILLYSFL